MASIQGTFTPKGQDVPLKNGVVVPPVLTNSMVRHGRYMLTDHQLRMCQLLAQGMNSGEVANTLGLSRKTVSTVVLRVRDKLKARTLTQAIAMLSATNDVNPLPTEDY